MCIAFCVHMSGYQVSKEPRGGHLKLYIIVNLRVSVGIKLGNLWRNSQCS